MHLLLSRSIVPFSLLINAKRFPSVFIQRAYSNKRSGRAQNELLTGAGFDLTRLQRSVLLSAGPSPGHQEMRSRKMTLITARLVSPLMGCQSLQALRSQRQRSGLRCTSSGTSAMQSEDFLTLAAVFLMSGSAPQSFPVDSSQGDGG